jgi:hypothetical protein
MIESLKPEEAVQAVTKTSGGSKPGMTRYHLPGYVPVPVMVRGS